MLAPLLTCLRFVYERTGFAFYALRLTRSLRWLTPTINLAYATTLQGPLPKHEHTGPGLERDSHEVPTHFWSK